MDQTKYMEIQSNISGILLNSSNPDLFALFERYSNESFPELITVLFKLLSEESKNPIRIYASSAISNLIHSKDESNLAALYKRWKSLSDEHRNELKQMALQTLYSPFVLAANQAAQLIAYIAFFELPDNSWPELIDTLLGSITSDGLSNENKGAMLKCLGNICERIAPNVLSSKCDAILTAIVHGLRDEDPEIKVASADALQNAIIFSKVVFERQEERDFLMDVLTTSCQHSEARVRKSSLQCLVQIAMNYYEYLPDYIQNIFSITRTLIQEDEEEVAFQAVEFWSSIFDKEIEINHLISMAEESRTETKVENHQFILGATQYLAEVLCQSILRSEVSNIQENNSLASGASTCLSLMASTIGDSIVEYILPFVEENIKSAEEINKEAAVLVFGSVFEGTSPEKMHDIISSSFSFLFALMKDPSETVRSTSSWTLSRISQFHVYSLLDVNDDFLQVVSESLNDVPIVAANACKTLSYYAENCRDLGERNPIIPFASAMINALLQTAQRPDAHEHSLKNTAFDAINSIIGSAFNLNPSELIPLAKLFYEKLKETLAVSLDVETKEEHQLDYCGTLQVITATLGEHIKELATPLMKVYLELLQNQQSMIYEEALHCVYRLVFSIKDEFRPFVEAIMPHILNGISNPADEKVFKYSVFLISDITRYVIQGEIHQYCNAIVPALVQSIGYPQMSMFNRSSILTCLGGIAEATGHLFRDYVPHVMDILINAAENSLLQNLATEKNERIVNDTFVLREVVLESFISMTLLPKDVGLTVDHAIGILRLISSFMVDIRSDDIVLLSIQLIGEVVSRFGNELQFNVKDQFAQILQEGLQHPNPSIVEASQWTKEIIQNVYG